MRAGLLFLLLVSLSVQQKILPNAWICDWIGIQGASHALKAKYRTLINNLNHDKTLKAQQDRATAWIRANAADLPELQLRGIGLPPPPMPAPPHADLQPYVVSVSKARVVETKEPRVVEFPETIDVSVIDNTIYNVKYWLAMRWRDLAFIDDILERIAPKINKEKLEEIRTLIWAKDKKFHNFYRPHYDAIKQQALARVHSLPRRSAVRLLMERAENADEKFEQLKALLPLMEPMAAEFFTGCGV